VQELRKTDVEVQVQIGSGNFKMTHAIGCMCPQCASFTPCVDVVTHTEFKST